VNLVAQSWQAPGVWFAVGLFAGVLSYFSCLWALRLAQKSGMIALPGERQSLMRHQPVVVLAWFSVL
jgi:hypothetical protein